MALRELTIAIGFQIESHPLVEANQATDALRDNVLGAGADALQLGANIEVAGATATASLGAATASTQQLGAAAVQASADVSAGLSSAASESGQLGAAVDELKGPFARLREAGSEALDALKAKYAEHREEIENIGKTLKENRAVIAGIFGATAGTIGFSVRTAADFEQAMSRVGALVRATDEELAILSRTARDLGASTVFSASQAAEGMSYLAMAGFSVQEIVEAMPGLLDTAAAAQSGLGVTADIVSNILSGFQLEARETTRIADVLTATFTSSNTTLEMLGDTMSYVAPVASALGISIEEVAAMTGRLGDVGIQGQRAGTALRAILTRLASPSGEAARLIQELGIQITDSSGNMLPFIDILRQIETATQNMGSAQRSAVLTTLVGMEAVSAFSALLDVGADNIQSYADELRASAGVAQEVASRQLDNLKGALEELGGAFEEAQISIGNAFIPAIRLGATVLTNVVNIFNALPEPVKTVIAVGLGFVAMLSGLALAASFIIPQLSQMGALLRLAQTGFMAALRVVPLFTAGLAKLGATISISFWPVTLAIGAVIAGVLLIQDVMTYLRGEGDSLTGRVIAWGKEWIGGLAQPIVTAFGRVQDFVGRTVMGIRNLGGVIADMPRRIAGWFIGGFQAGLQWLSGLPQRTLQTLGMWLDSIREWFATTFNLGDVLAAGIQRAMDWIPAPLRSIAEKILSFLPQSPAEEGPLANLDRVGPGLVRTVADSIAGADVSPILSAMNQALGHVPMPGVEDEGTGTPPGAGGPWLGYGGPVINLNLQVEVDARGATVEDAERIGETTADRIRQVIEDFVLADWYAVALQEV